VSPMGFGRQLVINFDKGQVTWLNGRLAAWMLTSVIIPEGNFQIGSHLVCLIFSSHCLPFFGIAMTRSLLKIELILIPVK